MCRKYLTYVVIQADADIHTVVYFFASNILANNQLSARELKAIAIFRCFEGFYVFSVWKMYLNCVNKIAPLFIF